MITKKDLIKINDYLWEIPKKLFPEKKLLKIWKIAALSLSVIRSGLSKKVARLTPLAVIKGE